jgi:hypothetical protein
MSQGPVLRALMSQTPVPCSRARKIIPPRIQSIDRRLDEEFCSTLDHKSTGSKLSNMCWKNRRDIGLCLRNAACLGTSDCKVYAQSCLVYLCIHTE